MKTATKSKKSGPSRLRTASGSSLGPREELLRESIRCQIASEPYTTWSKEETWDEAKKLAASLYKPPEVVRKAMYNRRNFINRKIEMALIEYEVLDIESPLIDAIAEKVQTIAVNVCRFLELHMAKITAEINAKHAV